jgi:hypothetical protein
MFAGASPMGRTVGIEPREKKPMSVNASLLPMT